jgi:hypothetical protein
MHVVNKNPTKYIVYLTIMQYNYDNIQENMMKQKAETKNFNKLQCVVAIYRCGYMSSTSSKGSTRYLNDIRIPTKSLFSKRRICFGSE